MQTVEPLVAGRYRLGSLIATGGMSTVHRAWDVLMQRLVAFKRYTPNPDPAAQRRFRTEARTLAGLSHPGLVAVYDAGTDLDTEQPYLVLQLIEGVTLRARIAAGPLHPDEVRVLGARLAHALAYVHARGVIHRDVKPSNVLVDYDGMPYLADFGISRVIDGARVTGTGQFVGTAGYLAPEQVRGQDGGPPVDVYALGLALLECLTGHAEYPGNDIESAVARLSRPPRVPEGTPIDLANLIAAMTSADPRRRPSAARCAAVLAGGPPVPVCPDPTAPRRLFMTTTLRQRMAFALAVVITAVTAGLGLVLLGLAEPAEPAPAELQPPTHAPAMVGAVPARNAAPATVAAEPAAPETPVAKEPAAVQRQPARSDRDGDGRESREDRSGSGKSGKGKSGKSGRG